MKHFFALALVMLFAVGTLSGCGTDKTGNGNAGSGSNTVTGSGETSADQAGDALVDDGTLSDPDGDGVDENVTDPDENGLGASTSGDGTVTGSSSTTGTTPGTTTGTVTKQHSVIRGATYEQMLRNGYVHDTDGDLTDHENAVTPGTVY